MKKITILGAGMVGKAMAADLCDDYQVIAADICSEALAEIRASHPVHTVTTDLGDPANIRAVIADSDIVIGSLPGSMGFEALRTVIDCGKNIVDISFFEEDPFDLDELARTKNVIAVVDCGVAPGMSNIILGHHHVTMTVERFECQVGGLPVVRTWPYEYKAPFSPADVIEEYTRAARIVENRQVIVKPALSDPELLEFEGIGTLEAFNTDGLRTLVKTMPVPNMKEKTLRYPGHLEYVRVLRETGFFDENPINVKGVFVRPIDVTTKLIFPKWKLEKDEEEFTVMRVSIEGQENDRDKTYEYQLLDRYDKASGISSMARSTGYVCSAVARLVLKNQFAQKGICPPEYVGAAQGCFEKIMNYLEKRNVRYRVLSL